MTFAMKSVTPGPLRQMLALAVLAASALGTPSSAGQAADAFRITINVLPRTDTCTAAVAEGRPLVNCTPVVVGGGGGGGGQEAGGLQGYRLPDARMKVVGALVEVSEENFYAWGEYSSRIVAYGDVEYVQMMVTW